MKITKTAERWLAYNLKSILVSFSFNKELIVTECNGNPLSTTDPA